MVKDVTNQGEVPMNRTPTLIAFDARAAVQKKGSVVRAVALILPGGHVNGRGKYRRFAEHDLRSLARLLSARGGPELSVMLLRYRCRGWNGERADPLVDTRWALERLTEMHGSVPVVLIGYSMGGRAAFRAAGYPTVAAVVGIAPWSPEGEPVEQVAGRKVLILHGARDRSDAPAELSFEYASRLRAIVPDLARMEVEGSGHLLFGRIRDCWSAAANFALSVVGGEPLAPALAAAMDAPAPKGLRSALPVGFRS